MEITEKFRQALLSEPDETLETLVQLRFVWNDSVTREERDLFYVRQQVAEDILAERHGVPLPVRTDSGSIWEK